MRVYYIRNTENGLYHRGGTSWNFGLMSRAKVYTELRFAKSAFSQCENNDRRDIKAEIIEAYITSVNVVYHN